MPQKTQRDRASTFVISITPFGADGRLDEDGFRGHLRRLAASGIGVYVGGGGSGEGYTLSPDEARRVLDIAVEELKGKVPVRAMGVEPRTAQQMVDFATMAKASGVDAVQIYSLDVGHAHVPTTEELEAYFTEVLDAVDVPAILSTHQSVGYKISPELIGDLVRRYDHLIGVNCSHGDLVYLASIIDLVAARTDILVGGAMQGLAALSLGAHGYLSSEGNLAPKLCMSAIQAYQKGDTDGMLEAFGKVVRLSGGLYGNGGIRATKAVLDHLGLPGGYPRKPRLPVKDERLSRALKVVEELGLAKIEGWAA